MLQSDCGDKHECILFHDFMLIYICDIYNIFIYIYIYIYIYIHTHTFSLQTLVTSTECSTLGANTSCLKKRRLSTTKASLYLQSLGILFVLCSRNNKTICQKQYIKKYIK